MIGLRDLLAFSISMILILVSTFMPSRINHPNELSRVGFGYPLHFLFQDQSTLDPIAVKYSRYFLSPLEYPVVDFSLANLILSVIIMWGILIILFKLWVVLKTIILNKGT